MTSLTIDTHFDAEREKEGEKFLKAVRKLMTSSDAAYDAAGKIDHNEIKWRTRELYLKVVVIFEMLEIMFREHSEKYAQRSIELKYVLGCFELAHIDDAQKYISAWMDAGTTRGDDADGYISNIIGQYERFIRLVVEGRDRMDANRPNNGEHGEGPCGEHLEPISHNADTSSHVKLENQLKLANTAFIEMKSFLHSQKVRHQSSLQTLALRIKREESAGQLKRFQKSGGFKKESQIILSRLEADHAFYSKLSKDFTASIRGFIRKIFDG